MSDIIRQLPDSVANQIAAGEVVQRPASVIKELVENSIDAGATEIQIIIKDAGRTLIQVIDNGKGMSPTDARMAFERHATSKISSAQDLFSLHTMGFRGEALPSICAISTVEMRTMAEGADLGTKLIITASKTESQEPDVCAKGCNISVRNLFFNVPARRKFLRSDAVEMANIMREFERLALVNHEVRMSIDTGSRSHVFRPGSFKQRIADLWKNNLNLQLLPIEVDTSVAKISGFVSRPEFARRKNPLQYLIVNGRNMQHPYFRKAVESAYDGMIAADTRPCFFLRFEVEPQSIDVNIHPTKQEIKFENEQIIWPILHAAVKSALGKFSAGPSIDFTADALQISPAKKGDFVPSPTTGIDQSYNPFRQSTSGNPFSSGESLSSRKNKDNRVNKNWDRLYADFMNASSDNKSVVEKKSDIGKEKEALFINEIKDEEVPFCLQCGAKYIITTSREGLMIIDQYRAHVKVLYERYLSDARSSLKENVSQRLIFPETLFVDMEQEELLQEMLPSLKTLGFIIEPLESGGCSISGIPASLPSGSNASELVTGILSSMNPDNPDVTVDTERQTSDDMLKRIALSLSRGSAIQRGRVLTTSEMEHLLSELFRLPDPMFTPYGKPVMRTLSSDELSSFLK